MYVELFYLFWMLQKLLDSCRIWESSISDTMDTGALELTESLPFPPANVHRLCEELQIHLAQLTSYDQLHATDAGGDVRDWHPGDLPARLRLRPPAGRAP